MEAKVERCVGTPMPLEYKHTSFVGKYLPGSHICSLLHQDDILTAIICRDHTFVHIGRVSVIFVPVHGILKIVARFLFHIRNNIGMDASPHTLVYGKTEQVVTRESLVDSSFHYGENAAFYYIR